ncbi:hypothetical protein [Sphingosinicella humi]|uniref:hypothetical protein n=1 Tax=Allosphingosinicella humi TaxID=2068657 RepID=UPI00130493FB|nr:hypothetical protein [Sphingosinicella humi]
MIEFVAYFSAAMAVAVVGAISAVAIIKPRRRRALEKRHHQSKREQLRSQG